jgi:hypothetical protein
MAGMTSGEILRLVNGYIGVSGGYLGDFSYRSHEEFYALLGLEIDPNDYMGTTRQRFIEILKGSDPQTQATIVSGILDKYPVHSEPPVGSDAIRTAQRAAEFESIVARLRSAPSVNSIHPQVSSAVVTRAINDAEILIETTGATSGVDRIHTAIHGYFKALCREAEIECDEDIRVDQFFKLLLAEHAAFQDLGSRGQDIKTILKSFSSILSALNPIRNRASVAHPNDHLLENHEAMFVINVARTLIQYVDARLGDCTEPAK